MLRTQSQPGKPLTQQEPQTMATALFSNTKEPNSQHAHNSKVTPSNLGMPSDPADQPGQTIPRYGHWDRASAVSAATTIATRPLEYEQEQQRPWPVLSSFPIGGVECPIISMTRLFYSRSACCSAEWSPLPRQLQYRAEC